MGSENSVSCNEKYRETFGVGELFDFVIFEPRAVVGVVRAFFRSASSSRNRSSEKFQEKVSNSNNLISLDIPFTQGWIHGSWWIHVMDPGGSKWYIHLMDPGGSTR